MIELTDKSRDELIEELSDRIFEVWNKTLEINQAMSPQGESAAPTPGVYGSLWVTADEYLSGNIRQRLAEAEEWAAKDSHFERNVRALQEVLPRDVGPKEIFVQLGAPWIPAAVVDDFINGHLFKAMHRNRYGCIVGVKYVDMLGYWKLDESDAYQLRHTAENLKVWGTNRMDALTLARRRWSRG
jgi:N12 class adenine-specific DNA methylase